MQDPDSVEELVVRLHRANPEKALAFLTEVPESPDDVMLTPEMLAIAESPEDAASLVLQSVQAQINEA